MVDSADHAAHDDHVRLLAGVNSAGDPVHELVPAAPVEAGVYDVLGSPGLAWGCAAGDRIRVEADGRFEVVRRGGNLCLVVVPSGPVDESELAGLRSTFAEFGGLVEMPADGRFIVITVPVTAGFPVAEGAVEAWARRNGAEWVFGNVYDEDDNPLGWWT